MTMQLADLSRRTTTTASGNKVQFRVQDIWGFSKQGIEIPLGADQRLQSGEIAFLMDPHAPPEGNAGWVDFERGVLHVRYDVQAFSSTVFQLVRDAGLDPRLMEPVRLNHVEECILKEDLSGWYARGITKTAPDSLWHAAGSG